MIKTYLTICFLAVMCLFGCPTLLAQSPQPPTSRATPETPPDRALAVSQVFAGSPAEEAGIKPMDLITKYGDYQIVDDAGFFAARNHYEKSSTPEVEIVVWRVWRATLKMKLKVPTGWLGVRTIENDRLSRQFWFLMSRINARREVPEYKHNEWPYKGQFAEAPEKILEQAKALLDQAERDGTLTPAQLLVDRIYMILDDAPEEDLERQSQLLKELIETQPVNLIHMLGSDKFFEDKRYRAAVACFKQYLKTFRRDVSIGLNLAFAYNRLGMYSEAEEAADYVFDHKLGLSDKGYVVGYQAKAIAALGLKDYRKSIQFAEKSLAITPDPYALMLILVAAAQMGDQGNLK